MMIPSRSEAWALLVDWTQSESLRTHALAVEAAVCGYARTFGEDEAGWGIVAPTDSRRKRPPSRGSPFHG